MKEVIIKCTKMVLVLSENELFSGLKTEILQAAIQRGKSYRRSAACENRQAQVDRWHLYEWLKSGRVPENVISLVESMNSSELREGVIEFLLGRK